MWIECVHHLMQINLENKLGVSGIDIYIYIWVVVDQLPASKYCSDMLQNCIE
jgi:hypothetical protein